MCFMKVPYGFDIYIYITYVFCIVRVFSLALRRFWNHNIHNVNWMIASRCTVVVSPLGRAFYEESMCDIKRCQSYLPEANIKENRPKIKNCSIRPSGCEGSFATTREPPWSWIETISIHMFSYKPPFLLPWPSNMFTNPSSGGSRFLEKITPWTVQRTSRGYRW